MDTGEINPPPSAVKPLLLDSLRKPLLAYILGSTENEVEDWLTSEPESFGSEPQTRALEQLLIVLHNIPGDGPSTPRTLNLAYILGLYQPPFDTTLANVIMMISTTSSPIPEIRQTASLETILEKLVRDVHPIYLLPDGSDPFGMTPVSLHEHPTRKLFDAAVMKDERLARLFPLEDQYLGRHGSALRSTGQGGGVQLSTFAQTIIGSAWRAADMKTSATPSIDNHIKHGGLNRSMRHQR